MLRPVVMIGCGGSGQKAVRYIRNSVRRQLARSGWNQVIPRAWRFIGFDRPRLQPNDGGHGAFEQGDYQSFSARAGTIDALDRQLLELWPPNSPGYEELIGWRVRPSDRRVRWENSMRALGREDGLVTMASVIAPKIQEAFSECAAGGPELQRVSEHLGVRVPVGIATPEPIVVVLGSMAGGTGAGIMLDFIDLVRRTDERGALPIAILFAPDVCDPTSNIEVSSAQAANSLAFVSELMSAYWDNELSGSALIPANVATDNRGPHSVFVIGRKNLDGIDLQSSKT